MKAFRTISRRHNIHRPKLSANPARISAMNKLDAYTDRVADLAGKVGGAVKDHIPDRAMQWIETGAALGAVKTGTRVASKFVRRNPAIAVAAVAGAGLLLYAARRRRAKRIETISDGELIDGESSRVNTTIPVN